MKNRVLSKIYSVNYMKMKILPQNRITFLTPMTRHTFVHMRRSNCNRIFKHLSNVNAALILFAKIIDVFHSLNWHKL